MFCSTPLAMYLNVVQLAESFGVDEGVVNDWVRNDGLPSVPDRGRLLFDRAQVVAWAASRGLAARAGFLAQGSLAGKSTSQLEGLLRAGGIWRDVGAADVPKLQQQIAGNLPGANPSIQALLAQRVIAPQGITWAPVGHGLALPHLRAPVALGREAGLIAVLILRDPLPLSELAPDGEPITRLIFFVAPSPRAHLELLGQLSARLSRGSLRQLVLNAAPDAEILAAVSNPEVRPAGSSL